MANIQTLHERASEALINGQNDRALDFYKEILNEKPDDEIALSQLMDLYYDTNKELYYLTRANLNVVQQKLEHAINDCKKAINTNTDSLEANVKLARLYKITNKNLRAIDAFVRVLELVQDDFDTYVELADLYLVENSPQSAVQALQKGVDAFDAATGASAIKKKEFLQNMLAKVYFDLGDYENAAATAVDDGLKIKILLQKGDSAEAKKMLDAIKSDKLNKEQKASYYSLLAQYYYNEEKLDEALEAVDKYVDVNQPDAVSFQMKALIYASRGLEFESASNWGYCNKVRGKFEEAIVEFMHAYHSKPDDKNNLIELANLYEKTGEKFTAIEFWQKVYEIDGDENAKNILGDFYFEQGDYGLAEKYGKGRKTFSKNEELLYESEGLIGKIMKMFNR